MAASQLFVIRMTPPSFEHNNHFDRSALPFSSAQVYDRALYVGRDEIFAISKCPWRGLLGDLG